MLNAAQNRREATLIAHQLIADVFESAAESEIRPKANAKRADKMGEVHLVIGLLRKTFWVERTIELRVRNSIVLFSSGKGAKC